MEFRLKEILKEKGLTISGFANMVGITQANMSNIVNLKSSPTLDTLNRISEALNISVTELFRKEEDIEIYVKYRGQMHKITKKSILKIIEIGDDFVFPTV